MADILKGIPDLKVEWDIYRHSDYSSFNDLADLTASVTNGHYSSRVAIAVCAQGHPRQLRDAITHQLLRFRHRSNSSDYLVVAAPFITPDGAAVCEEEKVGYFDLAGNCRLQFAQCYIERTGKPNPFRKDTQAVAPNLYGPRSERVLRVLFQNKDKPWIVVPLAEAARVSVGTVSAVRTLLLEREWARDTPDGLQLTQAQALLKDWAVVWARRRERPRGFFTLLPLDQAEHKMADSARDQNRAFALTGAAGAWRRAPMTRYQRTQVYWEGDPAELANAAGFKPAESGANIHVFSPRDDGVFSHREEIDGVPVVSPLQLYLDLQRDPARGQEAAEHLWDTMLFPAHVQPA
ncbi:MAG TPA: type IV toxin-antitoxin system AbiEi family antitoxin [Rariglobus sp.]